MSNRPQAPAQASRAFLQAGTLPPLFATTPPTFDLQSHSRHSDGSLAPRDVVAAAAQAGVELLALSDHDSVNGVAEAQSAAGEIGIGLLSAVEITAIDGDYSDLHVLGYLLDHHDAVLLERLSHYRSQREGRAEAISAAIRSLGFEIDESLLRARTAEGKTIGRPHLAQAVAAHPANAQRLAGEELQDPTAFLVAYLIEGRPAFVPREGPSVGEAIATVHDAGGLAVWAHPFWDVSAAPEVLEKIDRFVALGLDGVECFYVAHTREQTELVAQHCAERDLLSTGSSDFHGPEHRQFRSFRAFSTYGLQPRLGALAS
jgi:3',5'-nucleoside bisphosphate phosphatase